MLLFQCLPVTFTQCGPKVLGPFFKNRRHKLFLIQNKLHWHMFFRILSVCFGVMNKTLDLISRNNFVKKMFVCSGHRDNVLARCDSIFLLLACQGVWNKNCTQLSLSQILFQNTKKYSLWDVQSLCYHS